MSDATAVLDRLPLQLKPQPPQLGTKEATAPETDTTTTKTKEKASSSSKKPSKKAPPKGSTSRSQKPKDMPRRPLSAYNLFFREERTRLLAEDRASWCLPAAPIPVSADKKDGEEKESNKEEGDGGTSKPAAAAPPVVPGLFAQMGREISARWKRVSKVDMDRYHAMARVESDRYKREMDEYTQIKAKLAAASKVHDQLQKRQPQSKKTTKKAGKTKQSDVVAPPPTTTSNAPIPPVDGANGTGGGYYVITPIVPSPTLAPFPEVNANNNNTNSFMTMMPPPSVGHHTSGLPTYSSLTGTDMAMYPSLSSDMLLQRLALIQREQQQLLLAQQLAALQQQHQQTVLSQNDTYYQQLLMANHNNRHHQYQAMASQQQQQQQLTSSQLANGGLQFPSFSGGTAATGGAATATNPMEHLLYLRSNGGSNYNNNTANYGSVSDAAGAALHAV